MFRVLQEYKYLFRNVCLKCSHNFSEVNLESKTTQKYKDMG